MSRYRDTGQMRRLLGNMLSLGSVGRLCDCGSGQVSQWEYDAQGIELCRLCPQCRTEKLKRYRHEILAGYTQADVNEPIEPEE